MALKNLPGHMPQAAQILAAASQSQSELMALLDDLLLHLETEESRSAACAVLHQVFGQIALEPQKYERFLVSKTIHMTGMAVDRPIRLLLTPAVFSPEFWGKTFAEGLLKKKEQFDDKVVVEVGTGSGWVSLFLLMVTKIKKIVGLDLNPVAIKMARLNTWLNGTDSDGRLILSLAGEPIIKAFQVEVSDLLGAPLSRGESFDHVIGCIPQVLHPNAATSKGVDTQSAYGLDEKDLYDLSNYCFEQGILEDRFGLPLIASALEQSQLCLNPGGKVTLILGGRPGRAAIESMFERRGYKPNLVWMRRIQQADDTDLVSLVGLEKLHDIKFHFYMNRDSNSQSSVSAETAVKLLENKQAIYHDLLVYQASTRHEKSVFDLVRNLHAMGLSDLRKELDFSTLEEERANFLAYFSHVLMQSMTMPYPHEKGDRGLRDKIAQYLANFCNYPITADEIFVGPARHELAASIFKAVGVEHRCVLLSAGIEKNYSETARSCGFEVVVGNNDLAELFALDQLLAPGVVLIAPDQFTDPSMIDFGAVCAQAQKHPERIYIIDDSSNFSISSHLGTNMTLRLAAQTKKLPPNLILLYGLIKNRMCPDLQLSFLVNAPANWLEALEIGAELSYSRIAYPTQMMYEWLFADLMSFPFPGESLARPIMSDDELQSRKGLDLPLSPLLQSIKQDPVFAPKVIDVEALQEDNLLLRMDYGEFETKIPRPLAKGLIKGFFEDEAVAGAGQQHLADIVTDRIAAYMRHTRHVEVDPRRISLAQGVFPVFGAIIAAFRHKLGRAPRVALPDGSYGPLYPMLRYFGAELLPIATASDRAYSSSSKDLVFEPGKVPDILWLTQPGNPSGIFLDPERLRTIIDTCVKQKIYVFSDEIFFLLSDHRLGKWTPAALSAGAFCNSPEYSPYLFVADGASKAFAAGGLRVGFVVSPDQIWAQSISRHLILPPRATLRACDNLYSAFLKKSPNPMLDVHALFAEVEEYLIDKRKLLSGHREALQALLERHDLHDRIDTPYRGGLFMMARLDDRADDLAIDQHLLINKPQWSRTPGLARLCYCLRQDRFKQALERLERYLDGK